MQQSNYHMNGMNRQLRNTNRKVTHNVVLTVCPTITNHGNVRLIIIHVICLVACLFNGPQLSLSETLSVLTSYFSVPQSQTILILLLWRITGYPALRELDWKNAYVCIVTFDIHCGRITDSSCEFHDLVFHSDRTRRDSF